MTRLEKVPRLENVPINALMEHLSNKDIARLAMVSRTMRTKLKAKTTELRRLHTKKRKQRSPPSGERSAKRARR